MEHPVYISFHNHASIFFNILTATIESFCNIVDPDIINAKPHVILFLFNC